MPGRFVSDQYRALANNELEILKAVWMCMVAPRTETLHLENGQDSYEETEMLRFDVKAFPYEQSGSIERLENYIAPKHSKVYIDKDKHAAAVYVDRAVRPRSAVWLRVISAIPMLLPWLFEGENKLQPDEYALLQLVYKISQKETTESRDAFWAATGPFVTRYEYDMIAFRNAAKELTINSKKRQIDETTCNINACNARIRELQDAISQQLRHIEEYNARLVYLHRNNEDELREEVYNYLRNGSFQIDYVNSSDNQVSYTVLTTLSCYDEDMVESYVLEDDSVLEGYSDIGRGSHVIDNPYNNKEMAAFYRAVLLDHRFEIKMAASYRIDSSAHVRAIESDTPSEPIVEGYINNPHIAYVSCLGGYSSDLTEAERHHDFIAALAITQQSASNVSLSETWAMGRVTQQLVFSSGRVIYNVQDGTYLTFEEAMHIIRAEMQSREEE